MAKRGKRDETGKGIKMENDMISVCPSNIKEKKAETATVIPFRPRRLISDELANQQVTSLISWYEKTL